MRKIVITAFGGDDVCRWAYERGASVYLRKPIHFPELEVLIRKLIAAHATREQNRNSWNSDYLSRKND